MRFVATNALRSIDPEAAEKAGARLLHGLGQTSPTPLRLCAQAKTSGTKEVIVAFPWVLGDNYEEVIESLSRLADAGLTLHVVARKPEPGRN